MMRIKIHRKWSGRAGLAATALAVLFSLGIVPAASTEKPISTKLEEKVDVVSIPVPVYVTKGGEPYPGLTLDHFEVTDNGKKVDIREVDIQDMNIRTTHPGQQAPIIPASARRYFLLLFDLSYSTPSALTRARTAARDVILNSFHTEDLVGIASYGAGQGVRIALNFTSDHRQALEAVDSFYAPIERSGFVDSLQVTLVAPHLLEPGVMSTSETAGTGRQALLQQDEVVEHRRSMERIAKETELTGLRNNVSAMAGDLAGLARLLDSVSGRKHIIFLSEGFSDDLFLATPDQQEQNRMNTARESGKIWEVNTAKRFGDISVQSDLYAMTEEFLKSDCVIHSINIANTSGSTPSRKGSGGNQGLFMMASDTGGTYTDYTNKIGEAMEDVLAMTSITYILSFQPRDLKKDGKFHKLKIKLKNAPKGLKISYRPGYYAPLPYEQRTPKQRQLAHATQVMAEVEGGAFDVNASAHPFLRSDGKWFVPFLLEISGRSLTQGYLEPTLPLQIYAYALDRDGRVRDLLSQTVGIDLEKAGTAFLEAGLKYYGTVTLNPGDYSLRVLVVNSKTGDSTLKIISFHAPEPDQAGKALLPPMIPDPRGRWLLTRQTPPEGDTPFPFMSADGPYLPSSSKPAILDAPVELVLTGRLGEVVPPQLRWIVENDAGEQVRTTVIPEARLAPSGMTGYDALSIRFDPDGLKSGDYRLKLALMNPEGGQVESPALRFHVK